MCIFILKRQLTRAQTRATMRAKCEPSAPRRHSSGTSLPFPSAIWTLFFRDNVTGHTLVALGKGREVPELCHRGADGSRFARMVARVCACVGTLLWAKMHMGFLLRQYRCPLATRVVNEKGSRVARPQSTKVPTCRFSAKKEGVWCELMRTGANSQIFGEKGSCVA